MPARLPLLLLLLVLLLAGRAGRAQVYEPGWLVTAAGDTLRGELENAFWDEPPAFIRFRAGAGQPSRLLLPRQVRAFSFAGGRYFQFLVLPLDHAAHVALDDLTVGNYVDVQPDSVLAEVLVEGPLMLWRVRRDGILHLVLRRAGQPPLALAERRYLRAAPGGALAVVDGNNYRSQLGYYLGDCPAAQAAVARAAYSARELVAVVRAYTESCAPGQGTARSWLARSVPRHRLAVQGGLLAGLRYNHIGPAEGGCGDCALRPFGGLYLEVLQPSRTVAIYGELSASSFANTAVLNYTSQPSTYAYRALLLTSRLGLRYLLPLPREQHLLLGLGVELNFIGQPVITQTGGPLAPFSRDEVRYATPALLPNLAVGWRYQRLSLLLDGQLYRDRQAPDLGDIVFGNSIALRAGASLRLGPHPDYPRARRAAAP